MIKAEKLRKSTNLFYVGEDIMRMNGTNYDTIDEWHHLFYGFEIFLLVFRGPVSPTCPFNDWVLFEICGKFVIFVTQIKSDLIDIDFEFRLSDKFRKEMERIWNGINITKYLMISVLERLDFSSYCY